MPTSAVLPNEAVYGEAQCGEKEEGITPRSTVQSIDLQEAAASTLSLHSLMGKPDCDFMTYLHQSVEVIMGRELGPTKHLVNDSLWAKRAKYEKHDIIEMKPYSVERLCFHRFNGGTCRCQRARTSCRVMQQFWEALARFVV